MNFVIIQASYFNDVKKFHNGDGSPCRLIGVIPLNMGTSRKERGGYA
jgi:hypothetical protein